LNIIVADDLDAVAPGIAEVKEMAVYWGYAGCVEGAPGCLLVIDHETEMAASVCTLIPSLLQGDELIAQIDECTTRLPTFLRRQWSVQ
jgi:hypothetical protein